MAPPTEHRCPACGRVAATTGRVLVPVGRPFVECPGCQAHVSRPPYDEWSALSGLARLRILASIAMIAIALGLVPGLLYALVASLRSAPSSRESLVAFVVVGLIVSLALWTHALLGAIRASRRRMGDPMYRARLAEFQMAQVHAR